MRWKCTGHTSGEGVILQGGFLGWYGAFYIENPESMTPESLMIYCNLIRREVEIKINETTD